MVNKEDVTNVVVEGVNPTDYPDFSDAFISSADYKGKPISEEQLNKLNEDCDFVYNCIIKQIY